MTTQSKRRSSVEGHAAGAVGPRWTYGKFGYALNQSLRQLKRHKVASTLTIIVLGITLALPVILFFANSSLQQLSTRSLAGESLTAYLRNDITNLRGAELAEQWRDAPGIRDTRYISPEEAMELFRTHSNIGTAIDALEENPLPGAIMVFPDNNTLSTARSEALAAELRKLEVVARVQLDLRWVKRLQAIVALIQLIGSLLAGFLTLTALLVIGNTIRLELLRRRSEMEVASLLGAGNGFMNRPILLTGALYGFLGGVVACAIALFALNAIRQPADELSSLYESSFQLTMPDASQILLVLGISTVLGLAGALSSLRRPAQQLAQNGSGL